MFLGIRREEIKILLEKLVSKSVEPPMVSSNGGFAKVELRPMFSELSFNIVMRMVTGKRPRNCDIAWGNRHVGSDIRMDDV
ncbi:hypothetical protein Q3G72_035309 [Acer saccharum]|nr:hypothetical protein Q3G72_035309 [Acer saccharum]